MRRRPILLVVILGALVACYLLLLRSAPSPSSAEQRGFLSARPKGGAPVQSTVPEEAGEYDYVSVTIDIPAVAELPESWAKRRKCPRTAIDDLLGVKIGPGGGVRISRVEPDKPAASAGIQPEDRLGAPGQCPSALYGSLAPGEEARTIEWTVRRPRGKGSREPSAALSPSPQPPDARAGSR